MRAVAEAHRITGAWLRNDVTWSRAFEATRLDSTNYRDCMRRDSPFERKVISVLCEKRRMVPAQIGVFAPLLWDSARRRHQVV